MGAERVAHEASISDIHLFFIKYTFLSGLWGIVFLANYL